LLLWYFNSFPDMIHPDSFMQHGVPCTHIPLDVWTSGYLDTGAGRWPAAARTKWRGMSC
jgi:hypothetical protein